MKFSTLSDPTRWEAAPKQFIEFASNFEAKKAEALFNKISSQRDRLVFVLRGALNDHHNMLPNWREMARTLLDEIDREAK